MDIIPRKILSQPQTASPKYWYDNKAFETPLQRAVLYLSRRRALFHYQRAQLCSADY